MKIVIIGASFAGISCALQARKLYEDATITVLDSQEVIAYIPNGLNCYYRQTIQSLKQATFTIIDVLLKQQMIVSNLTTVSRIVPEIKHIYTETPQGEKIYVYDKLIIETGFTPYSHYITGAHLPCVVTTKDYQTSCVVKTISDDAFYTGTTKK